ncbi:stage II sporulation protein D [Metabacillus fastidiosus]|uniref:stage II sporulation protein D n=1 Tax=Metabacillus fastidiosus TaxID=1458 RepID=UPI003D273B20
MKSMKPIIFIFAALFIIILMIPTILVAPFMDKTKGQLGEELQQTKQEEAVSTEAGISIPIYRSQKQTIENVDLERYIIGVVASEMPAEFESEALKAQALAARTYIVKRLMSGEAMGSPKGSIATDTTNHQVYQNDAELRALWGKDYEKKMKKITAAVMATKGQILTFEEKPIEAQFFSTSNGFTENSEAYWSNPFPYLKSVESPWDKKSPKFYDQVVIPISNFEKKLGVNISKDGSVGKIIGKTPGKRVATVEIDGKEFSGRDIRQKLDLKSTDFSWKIKGDQVVINTKGSGHGVGMSQYGANFMAEGGKTYSEIVQYYYKGTKISEADPFLTKYTVKK